MLETRAAFANKKLLFVFYLDLNVMWLALDNKESQILSLNSSEIKYQISAQSKSFCFFMEASKTPTFRRQRFQKSFKT